MPVTGRSEEQQILDNLCKSQKAEFLALYGRRRVGKTYLIKYFFAEQDYIYFQMTGIKNGTLTEQIERFVKAISDTFYKGSELKPRTSWFDAFDALTDAVNKHVDPKTKVVLFFDEFPWMATHKSKLLQALDHFWNHYWSHDPRIKLIVCGSSASWIINNILNNKGGLHNRVTRKILLKPFSLYETKKFLAAQGVKLNNWQIAQIYMVTGGIPFYLSYVEKGLSSTQVIEQLAFSENALLLNEFDNLLASLFDDAEPYIELLKIIAKNRSGVALTEIAKLAKHSSKGGRITNKLQQLKDAGFILGFKPHRNKRKGIYYRVIDEYTLFYFYWIEPLKDTLQEQGLTKGYWQELQTSAAWHSWSGYAFEAMVYKHLLQIRQALNIPATAIANTWRYVPTKDDDAVGAQIDLLFDRRDEVITLCEIKYSSKAFTIDKRYAAQLMQKHDVFVQRTRTKKQIFINMITARGLKDNPYSDELVSGVADLNDLFKNIE